MDPGRVINSIYFDAQVALSSDGVVPASGNCFPSTELGPITLGRARDGRANVQITAHGKGGFYSSPATEALSDVVIPLLVGRDGVPTNGRTVRSVARRLTKR